MKKIKMFENIIDDENLKVEEKLLLLISLRNLGLDGRVELKLNNLEKIYKRNLGSNFINIFNSLVEKEYLYTIACAEQNEAKEIKIKEEIYMQIPG